MATADDARRESEAARERLSAIAQELASRTTPEQLKELAREKGTEWRETAKLKAREKATDFKDNAKLKAREKATDLKEKAVERGGRMKESAGEHPGMMGLVGGLLGASAGLLLAKAGQRNREQAFERAGYRTYTPEYGYQPAVMPTEGYAAATYGAGLEEGYAGERSPAKERIGEAKERIASARENVSHRIEGARENVSHRIEGARERIGHARERLPDREQLKARSRQYYDRAVNDYPWALAAAAIGFGFVASMLVPETEAEKRRFGEAKRKASERLREYGEEMEHRIAGNDSGEERIAEPSPLTTPSTLVEPGGYGMDTETNPNLH